MKLTRRCLILATAGCLGTLGALELFVQAVDTPGYLDSKLSVEERIDDLLNRMTLK